jgi:AcrR family transcriptional regulator
VAKRDQSALGRGLELLWGLAEPSARGPKPSLSLDEIVRTAIAIADRSGLEAVTMRKVAEKLGFTTMSLYRHVPGKEELVEVMRDVALGEPPRPSLDAGWRPALAQWARASMALHHRHPWMLEMEIRRPPFGPNHLRWLDAALYILSDLGLSGEDMMSLVLVVDSYVRGTARIQVGMAREQQRAHAPAIELERVYARIFESVVTDERYPTLAKLVTAGVFAPQEPARDEFEIGLERVLDGLAAMITAP